MPTDISRLTLDDVGEFGLINLLVDGPLRYDDHDVRIVIGPGDDAAAWVPTSGSATLVTTDTMVEDVHFRPTTIGWFDLGWKAMAMNVSDIAAMGAHPRFAVVTVGLTPTMLVSAVLDLYSGMRALADQYGVRIIGGDTIASRHTLVNITLTGESAAVDGGGESGHAFLRRSAALAGDRILVTGTLGASAAGLRLLETGESSSTPCARHAILAHQHPIPRVGEALFLLRHGARAGADNSDGLLKQVALFCESSHVGAIVDSRLLPIDPCVQTLYPRDQIDLALTGGESYELVVTAPETVLSHVRDLWDQEFATALIDIGSIVSHDRGLKVVDFHGNLHDAGHWQQGFDHFGIVSALSR